LWTVGWSDGQHEPRFLIETGRRLLDTGEAGAASEFLAEAERIGRDLDRTDLRWEALVPAMKAARMLGMPDSAFARARRATACWESERSLPRDPEWRAARGALIGALYGQLGALLLSHPDSMAERRRAERAFDALQDFKARTLRERMRGPGPAASADASPSVTCARLQKEVLAPDELLLDFYLGPDISILLAVTRSECRGTALPGATDLKPRLRRFHSVVSSPAQAAGAAISRGDWERALEGTTSELHDLLLGPIADLLGGARSVVVITDGELNLIPPNLLLSRPSDGGTTDNGESRPAGTRPFQIVPSATILAELRGRAHRPRPIEGEPGMVLAVAGSTSRTGQVLAGARREVEDLERRFRHVTVGLPRADSLADRLAPYEVLHFAAHSTVDDQYPWRSAIHLESRDGDSTGGEAELRITASAIADLKLGARLAFLSSCQSAGGKVLAGEGVQGLACAFLGAGVPAVLASLWEVDDRTTARLVRLFYERIQAGRTIAQALTEAQGILRNRPETAHPYFWAGFVLIGDGSERLELPARGRTVASVLPWAIALAGILGLGIPFLARIRRPRIL
jgi:CHAT domain-containing protein